MCTCFSVVSGEFYPQSSSSHTLTPCYAPFAKMVSAEGAKWTKDNLGTQTECGQSTIFRDGSRHSDGRGGGRGAVIQTLR